jgi:hypothetical protein
MLKIEIPYSEVKGNRIEYEWNNDLLMAWIFIVDKNDDIVKLWEFQFEEV